MKSKRITKSALKSLRHPVSKRSGATYISPNVSERFPNKIATFIKDSIPEDAILYGKKAMNWVKENPKTTTTLAVVSALAIGAMVRSAFNSEKNYSL